MKQLLSLVADYLASAPFPALLVIKSTLLIALGAIAAITLRNRSASARYAAWTLTLAAVIALPLGMIAVPALRVAVAGSPNIVATYMAPATIHSAAAVPATVANTSSGSTTTVARSLPSGTPVYLWAIGMAFVLLRMLAGRISVGLITRRASPLRDESWTSLLSQESRLLELDRNVRLFSSPSVSSPLAAGVLAPVIILPDDSGGWDRAHREVVLRHELAHIAGGDMLICLLAGLASAVYWFNPLVWLAAAKLRAEQERACDDRVITLGLSAPDYAAHLLEVARTARRSGMHGLVSMAMARPSQLEGRLVAVLQDRDRASLTPARRITAVIGAFAVVSLISSIRPVAAESAVIVASLSAPDVSVPDVTESTVTADSIATADLVVRSGGTLTLDLKTGAGVTITGSDENRVLVRARLAGRDWRNTAIQMLGDNGDAVIRTSYRQDKRNMQSSHRIEVTVPRHFNVRVSSAGGGITIRGVEGTFSGSTGGGEIQIENARGSARLSTGGGTVNVFSSTLSGSVSTGGGSVLIQGVSGGLTGHSGTGDVLYGGGSGANTITYGEASRDGVRRGSDGRLYVRKSGGGVRIAEAPGGASISTGGGNVHVGTADGDVDVSTGGGTVDIGPLTGGGDVSTGAGDVTISIAHNPTRPLKISSGTGTVTLIVPGDLSADLDLETAYTRDRRPSRIRGDFSLSTAIAPEWNDSEGTPRRYVRARQSIGGGGTKITVKTINGDIIVRRR